MAFYQSVREVISDKKTRLSELIQSLDKRIEYYNNLKAPLSDKSYNSWFMISDDHKRNNEEEISNINITKEELDKLESSIIEYNNKIDEVGKVVNNKKNFEYGIQGLAKSKIPADLDMFELDREVYNQELRPVPFNPNNIRNNIDGGRKSKRHKKKHSRKSRKIRKIKK